MHASGLGLGWFAALVCLLGVYLPWRLSFEFLDATILLLYACLSSLLVVPIIAGSVGTQRERGLLDVRPPVDRATLCRKVLIAAGAGWCGALLILGAALLTVNLQNWHGRPLLPSAGVLASIAVLSLSLALLIGATGAGVALDAPSAASAARTLRGRLLSLLAGGFVLASVLPGQWKVFFDAQMTPENLARNSAILSPLLFLASFLLLRSALRRQFPPI